MPTAADPELAAFRLVLDAYSQHPRGREGFDAEQIATIRRLCREKKVVLLAFPPKSGGTFLVNAVGRTLSLLDGNASAPQLRGSFIPAGSQEQDLYFPGLLSFFLSARPPFAVIHNHPTATNGNVALIDLFGLKPIVMRRPILDMLKSRHDQALKLGELGGHGSSFPEDGFLDLPLEDQKDFLVCNVAPWYVKYYASWMLASHRGMDVLFLSFDEFRADAAGTVARILAHSGIEAREDAIDRALEQANANRDQLRFNRGVSGRGAEFFEQRHVEHLRRLVRTYSACDFGDLV